ncbi:MAG: hypothetical protein HRF49_02240 [bacterium]|jgi:hypothetical protein
MFRLILTAVGGLLVYASAVFHAPLAFSAEKEILAFVVSFNGNVKVAGVDAELGMPVRLDDTIKTVAGANAAIVLLDDKLYKIGESKTVKITSGLVSGDRSKLPKKNGTWAILLKKFQDKLKAERDMNQYGAIRSGSFDGPVTGAARGDVAAQVTSTRRDLGLDEKNPAYFLVGGSIWEYYGYYTDARSIYQNGQLRFPSNAELATAVMIVNAKIKGA